MSNSDSTSQDDHFLEKVQGLANHHNLILEEIDSYIDMMKDPVKKKKAQTIRDFL